MSLFGPCVNTDPLHCACSDPEAVGHPEMFEPNPLYTGGGGNAAGVVGINANDTYFSGMDDFMNRQIEAAPTYESNGESYHHCSLPFIYRCNI